MVADASSPEADAQQSAVAETLRELGADALPQALVFNKVDLLDAAARRDLESRHPDAVFISAATGEGVDDALAEVQESLSGRWLLRELDLPAARAFSLTALVRQSSQVLAQDAVRDRIRLRLRLTRENWDRLQKKLASTKRNS